ncbi:MAG TPA: class I SAM-dependent methyltransferase [Clostridiaceae bacterium]|nr:class I SAM-dependent methyltransferase [Clostridiaceae bacterium]
MNHKLNNNILVKEQYKDSKNLDARSYLHAKFSTNNYGWMNWLFDNMSFKSGCKILELGCGNGELWKSNLHRVGSDWEIVLTDFSEGMLETARNKIKDDRFKFLAVDAQDIPFAENSFDIVIANHMLYHVPDRKRAMSEISRVLKSEGSFYASTTGIKNMAGLRELINRFDSRINYPNRAEIIGFNLENGINELIEFFDDIRVVRYEDSLVITEAEPLINYVLSLKEFGNIATILIDDKLKDFKKYIEDIIKENGSIYITKDAGLFIAKNKR